MAAPLLSFNTHAGGQTIRGFASPHSAVDWDEEVVPALKSKLAKDADPLDDDRTEDTDMAIDIGERRRPAGRAKPAPRQNQYDEIIQDGLGSDELIPSEWATGSKARFLTATRQPAAHHQTNRSASESYAQSNAWQDDIVTIGAADLSWSAGDRRPESREDRMTRKASNLSSTKGQALQELDVNSSSNGQRYRSTPERFRTTSQGSTAVLADDSPSRIPTLKTSGGGPSSEQKAATPTTRSRTNTSQQQTRQRTVSTSSVKKPMPKWANHTYNGVAVSQKVLDEFGPLGGTPSKAVPYTPDNSMAVDEFGIPRSTSNPWDEELLPTVKRRLAQQAMMSNGGSRLSGVDGLVDTWDKNGMPLSTRSITPRKSSIRDTSRSGDGRLTGEQAKVTEEIVKQDDVETPKQVSYDQAESAALERMRRLTEQLDFGFQAGNDQTDGRPRDGQASEVMQLKPITPLPPNKMTHQPQDGESEVLRVQEQKRHERMQEQRERLHQQQQQRARHESNQDDQPVKGGCRCTIM